MSKKSKNRQQNNKVEDFQTAFTKAEWNGQGKRQRSRTKGKNKKLGKNSWSKTTGQNGGHSPTNSENSVDYSPSTDVISLAKQPTDTSNPQ